MTADNRRMSGEPMKVTEFLAYLLDSDITRELAIQLEDVYSFRTRAHDEERVLAHA
jgi:hypothetical protein